MSTTKVGGETQEQAVEKGGRWVTPEQYARLKDLEVDYVYDMAGGSPRTAKRFDERDIERFSRTKFRLWYQAPTVSGFSRPRLVQRGAE